MLRNLPGRARALLRVPRPRSSYGTRGTGRYLSPAARQDQLARRLGRRGSPQAGCARLGDDPRRPTYIKTIWGTGYRFIGGLSAQ